MRERLLVAVCCLAAVRGADAGERGLLAHWRFDEGEGAILHDSSGGANHGAIHEATWVHSGGSMALRFDGADDHVDFGERPGLSPTKAVSVEAWVHPEAVPASGEAGIVGKRFASYVLTYYGGGRCWWYISGGPNHCQATVGTGAWHHVAGTFDGETMKLYVDGILAAGKPSKHKAVATPGPFRMGNSTGEAQFTKGAHFKGMLDEVRVYSRALSAKEVLRHYRTTRLTGEIALRPSLYVFGGRLVVDMGLRGLGELPAGAAALVELWRAGGAQPLRSTKVGPLASWGTAEATLEVDELPAGDYELRAAVATRDGRRVGTVAKQAVAWPKRPQWPDAPNAKVLNNLVAALVDAAPARSGKGEFQFVNPRAGWVFVATTGRGGASVALDGQPLHTHRAADTLEAMRYLPKGAHRLAVKPAAAVGRLIARAVPELVFSKLGAHPHVREYGKYDWAFMSRHVLPNLNVLVTTGAKEYEPHLREWRQQGRRVLIECGVPGLRAKEAVTADEATTYWASHKGMTDPLLDGVLADEFWSGAGAAKYAAWTEAARRLRANARLKGRAFYPYCAPMYGDRASREFVQAVMDAGWSFAYERYLPEQRGEAAARAFLRSSLAESIAEWRKAMPGAERHMIACIGTFSQPPESLDVNPAADHKVFLDMQLHLLANDPACFGLGGVMTYLCSYTDEETVRWMGKLFRHYCIEGKNQRFTAAPYLLPHLANGDFEDGLNGWMVAPAEPASVAARPKPGFSWLQGRYPMTTQGDTVLWLKRSRRRPNIVSQPVKALEPGRLYTLRFYSGDFQDLSAEQKHVLTVQLSGAEVLKDRSFQHVFPNCYSHHHGPFDREHRAWMSYHWILFRAKARKAKLTIHDWATDREPGGPIGRELMLNFVQVQPYD